MKPHVLVRLFSITLLVLVVFAVATPTLAFQSSTGLFRDAGNMPALDKANERAVVRARYVDVNLDMLPGARGSAPAGSPVLLNLFADRSLMAVLDHVERKPNGLVWVGSLQGIELSTVNIVAEDNVVFGSVNYPGGMYFIRYAGNGVHAVQEIDQSKFPPEHDAIAATPAPRSSYTPNPDVAPDSGGSIDVMVVYTPALLAYAGNVDNANALVDLAVSQTNTSYANSGITQRVNLVYSGEVPYTEPGTGTDPDWRAALNDLTYGTGGLSGVPTLRNTYGADVVSLFTHWSSPAYCGLGRYMQTVSSSFESSAFSVVDGVCAVTNFSYAHEMGHNMGAHHDWYPLINPTEAPYTYNKGRINLSAKWRTIMAYNNLCADQIPTFDCTRIQYWSNPGLTYGGAPLGVAGGTKSDSTCYNNLSNPACDADNHLVLNNTAYTVANFRQHVWTGGTVKSYLPLLEKPAPPPSIATAGHWLSDNYAHEFYVTTNRNYIRQHTVYISVSGCGDYTISHNVDEPITSNHYSFTGAYYASGTFTSATTATVTDGLSDYYISGCGYVTTPVPWTRSYSWADSSQVDLPLADGLTITSPATSSHAVEVVPLH